jgi:hypothetical protein
VRPQPLPLHFSLFFFLAMRGMTLFHHSFSTMMYCLATGPKTIGLTDHRLKLSKLEAQTTFFSL